ncbi:hypothetical protein WMY93_018387 [Mugilogobius chulae]|uniref:C3H1-type domain-containing protein n=1 Tax=Mugilogobius chulae TaxID=88201 RepID=A0AAW0NJY8_9GOBI
MSCCSAMSDFDSDEDLLQSLTSFSISPAAASRRSMRLAALPASQLAFPGTGSAQLSQLAALLPGSSPPRPESPPPAVRPGGKRTRKSTVPPAAKRRRTTVPSEARAAPGPSSSLLPAPAAASDPALAPPPAPVPAAVPAPPQLSAGFPGSDPALLSASFLSAVQSLHRSVETLTDRLPGPAPAAAPLQPPPGRVAPPPVLTTPSAFSLDSALPGHQLGRPYTPCHANVSPRLRSKILLGRYVNLVSLILPSPEADRRVAYSAELTAVLKSSDPRLSRTSPLENFSSLSALIGMSSARFFLSYGRTVFYGYHRAFATKAAAAISQSNVRLDWSVLDTEVLIMLTQATPCTLCGSVGHSRSLCPSLPFQPDSVSEPGPPRGAATVFPSPLSAVDRHGRKIELYNDTPICNNFNESLCTYSNCRFLHVCSTCNDAHPKSVCPRRSSLTGVGRRTFRH